MKLQHSDYMKLAIAEAETARNLGEVPVGCVIVKDGNVLAMGHNTRESAGTALGHAEITAIAQACTQCGWRLSGCTLYVTLEPCPMCMGAILNARIDRVIFGAYDNTYGCCGSALDLNNGIFPHSVEILGGIREFECQKILNDFFILLRQKHGCESSCKSEKK